MCSAPSPPPMPRYVAPKAPDNAADFARSDAERRRRAASGYQGTILTGSGGVTEQANTATKTLLGQ